MWFSCVFIIAKNPMTFPRASAVCRFVSGELRLVRAAAETLPGVFASYTSKRLKPEHDTHRRPQTPKHNRCVLGSLLAALHGDVSTKEWWMSHCGFSAGGEAQMLELVESTRRRENARGAAFPTRSGDASPPWPVAGNVIRWMSRTTNREKLCRRERLCVTDKRVGE